MPNFNVMNDDSGQSNTCSPLMQPVVFLPILAEAIQDELAVFTHDMAENTVFLSSSANKVFNQSLGHWQTQPFWGALSDAPINAPFRSWKDTIESVATGRICEIIDQHGNRLKLKCWRVHILKDGQPVGMAGIARRLNASDNDTRNNSDLELWGRAQKLTAVESEVVDMVVKGMMNKEMAVILNVAVRTIESRRSRAMAKLEAKSVSELVQVWIKIQRAKECGVTS